LFRSGNRLGDFGGIARFERQLVGIPVSEHEIAERTDSGSRAIQKLISSAKPAIDQLRYSVLSGISSEPRVLTGVSANIGVRILLANNLRLLSARICLVRSV
jgi:hypothetical protein